MARVVRQGSAIMEGVDRREDNIGTRMGPRVGNRVFVRYHHGG